MAPKPSKGSAKPIPRIEISLGLSAELGDELLRALQLRFENNMNRHRGLEWPRIQAQLEASSDKLLSLGAMERTGGEPDVVGYSKETGEYIFYDCSAESPVGRRSICYDREGQEAREKQGVHPAGNAVDLAAAMGIDLLTEEDYRALQELGEFDLKTSSWIATPAGVRSLGGAFFCDRRYGRVFVYHNGAQSYYAARGFRGLFRV